VGCDFCQKDNVSNFITLYIFKIGILYLGVEYTLLLLLGGDGFVKKIRANTWNVYEDCK